MKINEIENYIDIGVTESPQIVQSSQFGLDDPVQNTNRAKEILKKKAEVIEDIGTHELIRTGDNSNGRYGLIRKGNPPKVDYFIQYETLDKVLTGKTVTQVLLWRKIGLGISGYTSHVFYDVLLKRYPTIMSDSQQTADGRRFWIDRMAESIRKGFQVGMVNFNSKKVSWYDGSISFEDWLKSMDGWDTPDSYQAKRFVISKDKF